MGGGVKETLRQANKLLVAHLLNQVVDSHGVDELAVADSLAVCESDGLLLGVHLGDLALLAESHLVLGQSVTHGNPDTTGSVAGREAKGGIGTPIASNLVENDILGHILDVRSGNTLSEPLALHLGAGISTKGLLRRTPKQWT